MALTRKRKHILWRVHRVKCFSQKLLSTAAWKQYQVDQVLLTIGMGLWASRQSSYLSQISQIIFLEKKLSCGEIFETFWEILRNFGRFCHILRDFTWRKIEPKMYICGEKMTNMRLGWEKRNSPAAQLIDCALHKLHSPSAGLSWERPGQGGG